MTYLEVVAGVLARNDQVLGCRRAPGRSAAGKWEFPGGKVESGEEPREALKRELLEELGAKVSVGNLLDRSSTVVGDLTIDLACYSVSLIGDEPTTSTDHDILRWIAHTDVHELDWADPDLPMVQRISQW